MTAGATVLDDATDEALPPHPEHPTAGAPMTHDDLLALHELLTTDTWFDQVTTAGCVNPVTAHSATPNPRGPRSPAARVSCPSARPLAPDRSPVAAGTRSFGRGDPRPSRPR